MRILLVEDEPRVARFVAKGLRERSYAVDIAGDGESAAPAKKSRSRKTATAEEAPAARRRKTA